MADILRKTGSALTFIETPQINQVSFSKGNLIVEDDGDVYYDPTTGSSIENRIKLKGALDGDGGEIKSDLTLVAPAVIHQAAEPTADDILVNKGYLDSQLQGVVHIENAETIIGKKTFKNQEGINLVNYKGTKYNTANCKLSTQLAAGYEDVTASPADIDSNLYINNKAVATEEYVTDNYVKQVAGKGLSTNDFDNTAKSQLETAYTYSQADHAPTDAEKNVIVGIQQNGTDLAVDSTTRKVNINTPIPGTTDPLMDGTANQGSKSGYAREDHRHPTDTTRATDNEVVHLAGNEEITGLKMFTEGMKLLAGDDSITLTGGVSAETLESYLAVNGKLLPTIDYTNDHYALKADITGVYKAKGNLVSANLNASLLTANSLGWVYNITDEFTINENFLEYDASNPKTYPAGTNVVIVQATPSTYKFDVLSGFIDTSTFATDSTVVHKTGDETITGLKEFTNGISVTKVDNVGKVSSLQVGAASVDIEAPSCNIAMSSDGMKLDGTDIMVYGDNTILQSDNLQCRNDIYFTNYQISSDHTENSGGLVFKGSANGSGNNQYNLYKIAPAPNGNGISFYSKDNNVSDKFSCADGIQLSGVSELHMNGLSGGLYLGYSKASADNSLNLPFVRINLANITTASPDPYIVNLEARNNNGVVHDATIRGICTPVENTDAANKKYVDDECTKKVDKSTSVSITLTSTNWSSGIYTYTNSAITATNIIELYPASTITSTQFEALQSANIIGGTQSADSIQLKAMGDAPTIDIPIVLTIRQDT